VIEWAPPASAEVVIVAVPPLSVPVPSVEAPSWKVTVPVRVPPTGEVTEAVKVTAAPIVEGLLEELTEAELAALPIICIRTGEVLPVKLASPP
jgi:hypothetical protein